MEPAIPATPVVPVHQQMTSWPWPWPDTCRTDGVVWQQGWRWGVARTLSRCGIAQLIHTAHCTLHTARCSLLTAHCTSVDMSRACQFSGSMATHHHTPLHCMYVSEPSVSTVRTFVLDGGCQSWARDDAARRGGVMAGTLSPLSHFGQLHASELHVELNKHS